MAKIHILFLALVSSGCTGHLYTHVDKSTACVKENASGDCTQYKGVLIRPLVKHIDRYQHDRILNAKGEVTHFAEATGAKKCLQTIVEEEKLVPDASAEYVVRYDPAFFESSTFNIELTPLGTISKVGSSSTPGGKALVESLTGLATTTRTLNHGVAAPAAAALIGSHPTCSHGKRYVP